MGDGSQIFDIEDPWCGKGKILNMKIWTHFNIKVKYLLWDAQKLSELFEEEAASVILATKHSSKVVSRFTLLDFRSGGKIFSKMSLNGIEEISL